MVKLKDHNSPDSFDARTRIIEVAARHFGDDGFKGASQRAIQREAGVNPAAAHYYFGSKEAMYHAVIDTFIHGIQQDRVRRLAELPINMKGKSKLKRLLLDYFEPSIVITETRSGLDYVRILARNSLERRQDIVNIFEEATRPVRELYLNRIQEIFPEADREELLDALAMGVGLMAVMAVGQARPGSASSARTAEKLAVFVAAGFEALFGPVSDQ